MKTKTFSLFALTILSLVMIAGMASAATIFSDNFNDGDLAGWTVTGWINNGTNLESVDIVSASLQRTIATTGFNNITVKYDRQLGADWETADNFKVSWSLDGATYTALEEVIGNSADALPDDNTFVTKTFNLPSSANNNVGFRLKFECTTNAVASEFCRLDNIFVEGTAITSTTIPEEITECSTTGNLGNDLRIEIDNLDVVKGVHGEGFGNDNELFPLDTIEAEIKVENDHATEKIKNIEVKWGLYDKNNDKWYIDEKESDFTLNDGDDKTLTVTFKLEDNIDDLANGNYVFYAWANGEINDATDTLVCTSNSQDVEMQIESDFVILDNIQFSDTAECGSEIQLTADVWNIGEDDQEGVYVQIINQALGINKKVTIGDVDAFENAKLDVLLSIPGNVDEGKFYPISLSVYNDNNEVYQNDYDDDESEFTASVKVEGNCGVSASVSTISAVLQSGGNAGEPLVVKTTISAEKAGTYVLKATGFSDWATTTSEQTPVVLVANTPKEVLLTFNVNDDASGTKTFNLELISGTDVVKTQPVVVTLEGKSGFSFGSLGDNKYLWIIGALNVLLVIIIIIVAIKVAMK